MKINLASSRKLILILTLGFLPVIVFFQNCSKVNLQSSQAAVGLVNLKTATSQICLPDNFTLESFFVTNLNMKSSRTGLSPDTDGDGLTDAEEILLGSDPYRRRSGGFVLDSICKDVDYGPQCANFNLQCDLTENAMGLNECDLLALQISKPTSLGGGLDSDKDGIPDYLEVRFHSFPNINDSLNDLDLDQVNTMSEIEQGTSVQENNNLIQPNDKVQIIKTKQTSSDCSGEMWTIEVKNLPTIVTGEFTDLPDNVIPSWGDRFSHASNENVIQTTLKIKSISGPTIPSRTYTAYKKVDIDVANKNKQINLNFILNDYFSGEVEQ